MCGHHSGCTCLLLELMCNDYSLECANDYKVLRVQVVLHAFGKWQDACTIQKINTNFVTNLPA